MLFEPLLHTKEFLISNPDILHKLASGSIEFAKSSLAQDHELLLQKHKYGGVVAHIMHNSEWMTTPASQDMKILSIVSNDGWTVAHGLTSEVEWLNTPAARDMSVLTLMGKKGYTVAHMMDFTYISELSNSKEVMMISTDELGSVAQSFIDQWPLENSEKVICHLVERGAAYDHKITGKISNRYTFSNEQFSKILGSIHKIVDEEPHAMIKLKKAIAAFSTLKNISNTLIDIARNNENKIHYDGMIERLSSTINGLVISQGLTIEDNVKFEDFNCGPGIGLLNQIFNKSTLEELDFTKLTEVQDITSINPLY
jgi:hypothetical protein